MADFEIEQLKTLFDSMAQRLDETAGDVGNRKELEQIKLAIKRLSVHIANSSEGNGAAENRQFVSDFFREWDKQNPLREVREAVENLHKEVEKNPLRQDSGNGGNNDDSNPLRSLMGESGDRGLTGNFKKLGGAASALMGAFGGLISAAGVGYNFLKNQGDIYRRVLASAEGSMTSIMDVRNTAARNDMSVEELVTALESSPALRSMGGRDYAQMSKAFRDNTLRSANLGMNMQQQTEAFAAYAETLRHQGNLRAFEPDQMANHFERLIGVNQEMASIMGLTRKEALEAAQAQSRNPNFNAALRGMGVGAAEQAEIANVLGPLKEIAPEVAALIEESTALRGTVRTEEMANYVAVDPAARALMQRMGELQASGQYTSENLRAAIQEFHQTTVNDSAQNRAMNAQLATQVAAGGNFATALAGMQGGLMMNYDPEKADRTNEQAMEEAGAATRAILGIEEAERRVAAGMDNILNNILTPAFDRFGGGMETAVHSVYGFADSLDDFAETLGDNPNAALGLGGAGLLATIAASGLGGLAAGKMGRGLLGRFMGGGGAGAGASATGAARGAGAMGKLGTVARFAGRALGPIGGGLMIYDGGSRAASSQDTATNAMGHGQAALGGAMAGAAIGSIIPGAGTLIGAGVGALIGGGGSMLYDWLDDSDAGPANASGGRTSTPRRAPAASRQAPANATGKGPDYKTTMTRINGKMLDVQQESLKTLQSIKSQNKEQLDIMREDLMATRQQTEKLSRLLEESNRNTREIKGIA